MTSSSTTSSNEGKGVPEKFGRTMRKAGNIFGIDLAGLFEDEGETTEGFEGFAPTFRMTSNLKGRSPNTATYKAPYQPSRTAEFTLGPRPAGGGSVGDINIDIRDAIGAPAPMPPKKEKKKEEILDRTLSSFIGSGGTGGAIGAQGIGKAQQYGYSDADIRAMAQQEGLKFGENAARSLGINTELTSAKGQAGTGGALGDSAVTNLRNRGLADEAIVSLARQQGLKFGEKAAASLGVGQDMMYQAPQAAAPSGGGGANLGQAAREIKQTFGSTAPQYSGGGGIGEVGIQKMADARGITFAQARDQARSAGLTIGARAAARR